MERGTSQDDQQRAGSQDEAVAELDRALERAGLYLHVNVVESELTISGEVESEDERQAAMDLAQPVADALGLTLVDAVDVMTFEPDTAWELSADEEPRQPSDATDAGYEVSMSDLEPDFTDEQGTSDPQEAAAEGIPYFPPTDPVVEPSDDEEELEVVGGFQGTSMDDETGGGGGDRRPDDDIAQDIARELNEDAATTDLMVDVDVRSGVAVLTGTVPSLEDAENAEAVAARVPGVVEVRERLHIPGLERHVGE